jgi:hypothetical protein
MEYAFPEYRLTNCLMAVDYTIANRCIQFGHIINFECDGIHGSTRSRPKVAAYVAELLRLRRRLADVLWYGRLVDPVGIEVSDPRVQLTAWKGRDGRRAIVLAHLEEGPIDVTVGMPRPVGTAILHRPFRAEEEVQLPCKIRVPRNRLVVVELQRA